MALQKLIDVAKASVTVSDTVPSTTDVGSLWFESDTAQFFIYYDNTWIEVGGAAVESIINTITGKGQLLVGTESAAVTNLAVGSDNFRLIANSATTSGLQWVADTYNTVIDAKGDLLVGSADNTVAKLSVSSIDGSILVADSTATNGVSWMTQNSTARNILYNGAMQIHQRGLSGPSTAGSGYQAADRWATQINTLGSWTTSVSTDVPSNPPQGFTKSLKLYCDTPDTSPTGIDYLIVEQKLEGFDCQFLRKGTSSALPLTVSFWVKSNITGTYIFELRDADNSRTISKSYTIDSANTWEFKVISIPADTVGTLSNDNGESLCCSWWLSAGTNFKSGSLQTSWGSLVDGNRAVGLVNLASATGNTWYMTGVQITAGTTPLPFQFKKYTEELLECQRYYWREWVGTTGQTGNTFILDNVVGAACDQSTWIRYPFRNPVVMRATPTVIYSNTNANFTNLTYNGGNGATALSALTCSYYAVNFYVYSGGIVTGHAACLRMNNANAYVGADAELV